MAQSIRAKLTLWYLGILALTLVFFGVFLYLHVAASWENSLDKSLQLQADAAASTISAFWNAEQSGQGSGNWQGTPAASLLGLVEKGYFPDLVNRWARDSDYLKKESRTLRILDRSGRTLAASNFFESLTAVADQIDFGQLVTTQFRTVRLDKSRMRLITRPNIDGRRLIYWVQVGTSMEQMDISLKRLRFSLFLVIPLTLLLAVLVGWFLACRAMDPVDRMIRQAQEISAEALDRRIDVPRANDEMMRLATTFNHMLSRLDRAFRRLRQFSAAASHELRTPLTAMKGELEVVLRRPRKPEEYQSILQTQLQTVDEMAAIVEQLLLLARSDGGEGAVQRVPIELNTLIREIHQVWKPRAAAKEIRLEILEKEAPIWVRGEKRLLERLFGNLLENAIRHTPPQGQVKLTIGLEEEAVCVKVEDTGPGISPELMPNLFDRFFQRAPVTNGGSIGLGLGLCRWIVEAHHGRIEVESSSEKGAFFTIWLPLVEPPQLDPNEIKISQSSPPR